MGRAGTDRVKRPGGRSRQDEQQRSGTAAAAAAAERYNEVPVRAGQGRSPQAFVANQSAPHHTRSTSTRWHRRPSNTLNQYSPPAHPPPSNSRTVTHHHSATIHVANQLIPASYPAEVHKSELAPNVAHQFGDPLPTPPGPQASDETHVPQRLEDLHFIHPPRMPPSNRQLQQRSPLTAATEDLAKSIRVQPEWEWGCRFARMNRCNLVNGVVCEPPDIGLIVGVIVKNSDVLLRLETDERLACDAEVNIRKSLGTSYSD